MTTEPCLTLTTMNGDAASVRLQRRGEAGDDDQSIPSTVVVASDDPGFAVVRNDDAVLEIEEISTHSSVLVNPMKGLGFGACVLLNRFDNEEQRDAADVAFWDEMEKLAYNKDDSECPLTNMLCALVACLSWNRALKFSAMDKRSHTAVDKISSLLYADVHKLHDNLDRAVSNSDKSVTKRRWRAQMYDDAVSEMTCPRQTLAERSEGGDWKVEEEQSWLVHVSRSNDVATRCNQEEVLQMIRKRKTLEFVKLGPWKLLVFMCRVLSTGASSGAKCRHEVGGQDVLRSGQSFLENMKGSKGSAATTEDTQSAKVLAFRCFADATLDIMRVKEMGAGRGEHTAPCAELCRCAAGLLRLVHEAELRVVSESLLDMETTCTKLCGWWVGISTLQPSPPESETATQHAAQSEPENAKSQPGVRDDAVVTKATHPRPRSKGPKAPHMQSMCIGNSTQAMVLVVALATDLMRPGLTHRHTRILTILDTKLALNVANQRVYHMVAAALREALDDFRGQRKDDADVVMKNEIAHCAACFDEMLSKDSPSRDATAVVLARLNQLRNTIAVFQQSMAVSGDASGTEANCAFALFYAAVLSLLAGQRKPPRVIENDRISFLSKYEVLTVHAFTSGLYESLTKLGVSQEPVPVTERPREEEQQPPDTADNPSPAKHTNARDEAPPPVTDDVGPSVPEPEATGPPVQPEEEVREREKPVPGSPERLVPKKKKKKIKRKREDTQGEATTSEPNQPVQEEQRKKKKKKKKQSPAPDE